MTTVGYIGVLLGLFVIRQATKGRSLGDVPGDMAALLVAVVTGDTNAMQEVLARKGEQTSDPNTTAGTAGSTPAAGDANAGQRVLSAMIDLAQKANNRYVWGGTGPDGYDCSGLVWAAMKQAGVYTGPRFNTGSMTQSLGSKLTLLGAGESTIGDVVLWPSHVGVIDGEGTMFSALNASDGIKHSPISYGPKGESYKVYRVS